MDRDAIDLRRLRYFIAVCDHGGISRASASVGISQPSLTRHIKLLEEELGFALLNRNGHGVGPTEQGRFLLDRARPLLEGIEDAIREARRRVSTLSGEVALGVCPTIAPLFLDEVSTQLRSTHPSVRLNVVEAYSGDLASMMGHGTIDLSLTYRPTEPRGVIVHDLVSEPLVLVTPPGLGEDIARCSLANVGTLDLILPSPIHELRRIIDSVSRRRGVMLVPDIELDSLSAVKSLLLASGARHATILPLNSVLREIADGRLRGTAIDDPLMMRTVAVVMPSKRRNATLVEAVSGLIRKRSEAIRLAG